MAKTQFGLSDIFAPSSSKAKGKGIGRLGGTGLSPPSPLEDPAADDRGPVSPEFQQTTSDLIQAIKHGDEQDAAILLKALQRMA